MANSVHRDVNGPDWPLGNIVVPVPGTPVGIMSLIDATAGSETTASAFDPDFSAVRFQQIVFQAVKAGAGPPALVANTGNIYIVRKPSPGGTGNKTDLGTIVKMLVPGETFVLAEPALSMNALSPYRYLIDADNANDACQVTGFVAG